MHGEGLFARKKLNTLETLGRYDGRCIKSDVSKMVVYEFASTMSYSSPNLLIVFRDRTWQLLDGQNRWHYINDFRGTGKSPNIEITLSGYVRVLRTINANEELLTDYGAEYWHDKFCEDTPCFVKNRYYDDDDDLSG